MKFASFPVDTSAGVILAHTFHSGAVTLKKGHVITLADIATLKNAGVQEVMGARLDAGDVGEDEAAAQIAARLAGTNVRLSNARTGRCNVEAENDGVVLIDGAAITTANLISETVTIASLEDKQAVKAGQIVATVKIIPFAVGADVLRQVQAALGEMAVNLAPFQPRRFALISTLTPGLKPSVVTSTEAVTRQRVAALGGQVTSATRVRHEISEVAHCVRTALAREAEVVLIAGASATVDRNDVVPAAIVAAGGVIDHFGMPVDPGNLLVLAHVNDVPILVLPGCARSPKLNGVDWVMQRLAAGVAVTSTAIMRMGVGGLLVDTPTRPLPRDSAVAPEPSRQPALGAVVLAAGQSRRMGAANKLLMAVDGELLIRRTVKTIQAAPLAQVVVVTGYQQAEVGQALAGLDVAKVHNPQFAEGLSTSLKVGLEALGPDIAGAIICLGDMPAISTEHIARLVAAFDPGNDRAIGVPTHNGKRGNPVIWARRFFKEMQELAGDVGARHLIGANESLVYEVEFGDTAVLTDLDTPEQWRDYLSKPAP